MFTMCIRASTLHWMGCTCHSGGKKGLTSGVSCPSVSWFLVTPFDWESCSGVGGMGRWQSSSFQDVEYSTFSHSIWSVCKTVSSPRMRNHQRISEPSLFLNFLRTSTFSPTLVNFRKVEIASCFPYCLLLVIAVNVIIMQDYINMFVFILFCGVYIALSII